MEQRYVDEVLATIQENVIGDFEVSSTVSRKNNGLELTGIIIRDNSNRNKIEPVFYINDYHEHGYSAQETAQLILQKYIEMKEVGVPAFDVRDITNFDVVKDRIRAKLINSELNEKYIEDKPYIQCADDLVACFYVDVNRDGSATIPITMSLMEVWGIENEKELYAITCENHSSAEIVSMAEAIIGTMPEMDLEIMKIKSGNGDLTNEEFKQFLMDSQAGMPEMYVWRDGDMHGASAILYQDNIEAVLEKLQGSFIVLPSSIHELIVLKYSDEYTIEELKNMIESVNQEQLRPEEVLSDHPYIVTEKGEIIVAKDTDDIVMANDIAVGQER